MYNIWILEEASRELARLDKPVGRRIVERINWLSEKLNDIRRNR
jgi:mRNA-degrading endonuclease RelE of RelBE toxin-antitoxin system